MNDFLNFLQENFLIVAVVLYAAGLFLKKIPEKYIPDWVIPFALWAAGILIGWGVMGAFTVATFMQGTLAAAVAVFGQNLIKQLGAAMKKGE